MSAAQVSWIGPLTLSERMDKVRRYMHKKGMKS